MLKAFEKFELSIPMQFLNEVGKAGIQKFQPAHLPDVGLDHHAVHPFDGRRNVHVLPQVVSHFNKALM